MGPAILALTEISSEPFPANSVIPSICRATYDRRLLPGETAESVLEPILSLGRKEGGQLEGTIGQGRYTTFTGEPLEQEKFFPAWLFPEDEPFLVQALAGLHGEGIPAEAMAYRFCTNAAYSAGIARVPTVGFGPGRETDAHVVDERLGLVDLEGAARGYRGIIQAVLGADPA
jgi:acetylornithine deacetylase/succinyl-diaminopimelate desuccinylase-like protein